MIFNDLGNIKNIEEKRDTSRKKKKTEKTEEEKALYKEYQKYIKSDEFKALREKSLRETDTAVYAVVEAERTEQSLIATIGVMPTCFMRENQLKIMWLFLI